MIEKLNPTVVIPVHYGTFVHYKEPIEKILEKDDIRIKIIKVRSKVVL